MSAWYLFSVMGFYPANPCGDDYVIGAPQVARATVRLANGKAFRMTARNLSEKNMYVKSVTLNGKRIAGWKLRHGDVMKGGEVVFEMCSRP